MKYTTRIKKRRRRRRFRVRNNVRAVSTRLRFCVFRSNKHIYAQIIDDQAGRSLVSASTMETDVLPQRGKGGNKTAAAKVGQALAKRALSEGIAQVAFDRGSYRYHGRIAALADAARQEGLKF